MSNTNLFIASAGEVPSNIQGQLKAEVAHHVPLGTSAAGWDMWGLRKVRTKDILNVHPRGLVSPSVVVYVQTSDWGYVSARADGDEVFLVIDHRGALDLWDGVRAVERCEQLYGRDWPAVAADLLSAWSAVAPRQISPAFARHLIEATDAFDAVLEVLDALGLEDLPA